MEETIFADDGIEAVSAAESVEDAVAVFVEGLHHHLAQCDEINA